MREQSAWLLPATPRARREEETVGAERRGPAAAAAAATSQRGPCSRASERFPQPRPSLLTPPPPALGLPQQFADSAATEGAGSRSPELARSAHSQSRRRAGGPAAAGGYALPGAAAAAAGPVPAPGLPEGACGAGVPPRPCASPAGGAGPGAASAPLPLGGLDGLLLLAPEDSGLESQPRLSL